MSMLVVSVPGMTCRHCVRSVTAALRDVPGVLAVLADAATATVVLHGTPDRTDVIEALAQCGFPGELCPGRNEARAELRDG